VSILSAAFEIASTICEYENQHNDDDIKSNGQPTRGDDWEGASEAAKLTRSGADVPDLLALTLAQ
jgi:hypothetical protein